ncbi:MAG TPA: hypothetical protein VJC16_05865, partial [Candidatus Nanoarchaeia archaeon]|nr:hypothetical protein [Candidatus Nanoarchaeia archaeon]
MKLNIASFVLFLAALLLLSILMGCAAPSSEDKKTEGNLTEITSASDNINSGGTQGRSERNDFGCWPPSCSVIPDPQGEKNCEDWKAGRPVAWPSDCGYFAGQPACRKLCGAETSSAPVEQQEVPEQQPQSSSPCDPAPLQRQFGNTPYYTGPLFDGHYHMPTFFKVPDHPGAPIIDKEISRRDVACLFDKDRVKGVFAFYSIPINLKDSSLQIIREIEQEYPGKITHFLEFVVFPGYSVDPVQIGDILDANKGLFKGYGEISLYLPHYSNVM